MNRRRQNNNFIRTVKSRLDMSSFEDETSGFDDMTLVYKRFLRSIAILPFENRGYTFPATQVLLFVNLAASCVNWSMFLCYTINQGVPSIDSICETVLVVGFNLRFYLLLWHRREIADLLAECREVWDECDVEGRRAVRQFERKVRVLFFAILGNTMFGHFLYSVNAVVFTLGAKAHPQNGSADHFLPYKWYADGAEDMWPGYEFNFALQVVLVAVVSSMAATVDSIAPLLIMLGAGFFRDLKGQLRRTGDNDDNACTDEDLVSCLRRHQRILSYCSRIDEITQILFFVQLLTTVYNVSLIGIKLSGTDPDKFKYFTVGIFNLAQLFICQWAPDHLIDESKAIATAAYCASFSWLKRRKGAWVVLMIERAQRPVQMTAAGLFHLSLENFGAMLKGALSFFTVLRNFNI